MRNTVLKSILVTLSAIVALFCVSFIILFLGFPQVLGKINSDLGRHSAAVNFYEKAYERNPDFQTLNDLIDESEYADNYKTMYLYGEKFVFDDKFEEFCLSKDKNGQTSLNTRDYYCGIILDAIFERKEVEPDVVSEANEKIVRIAFEKTTEYSRSCPLKLAILIVRKNSDKTLAELIVDKYDSIGDRFNDEGLSDDINQLRQI